MMGKSDSQRPKANWDRWAQEASLLMQLAVPTLVIQVGLAVPPVVAASYIGRAFGPIQLGAFQLANLTMNLFTVTLLQGLYTANDTLSPQAFAAGNYRQVGLIAMRGFMGSMAVVLPICITLYFCIEDVFLAVGEDLEVSIEATRWYRVHVFSMPFYALYMVVSLV